MKYDKFISLLLYGKDEKDTIAQFPALLQLHEFCKKVAPDVVFKKIYVNNTKIEKAGEKKVERKKTISKINFYTTIVATAIASVFSYHIINKEIEKQKTKENIENMIHKKIDNLFIESCYGHHHSSLK
jgi:hypothetical protein